MTRSQEMVFEDEGRILTDPSIILLEGISTSRASSLCKNIARSNCNVHLPYLSHLDVDRRIRLLLSRRLHSIDGVSGVLGSLATRKACLEQVHYARRARQDTGPSLVRMHILSTYSFVRDGSVTAERWLDLIEAAFGNRVPGRVVFLDHRCSNGNFDTGSVSNNSAVYLYEPSRDVKKTMRLILNEADRRAEALEAMCSRFDIQALYVPSGLSAGEDYRRVVSFMRTL